MKVEEYNALYARLDIEKQRRVWPGGGEGEDVQHVRVINERDGNVDEQENKERKGWKR